MTYINSSKPIGNRGVIMERNVLVAVGYGVEGEQLIKRAYEMLLPNDKLHILLLDYQNEDHAYNKIVDLEQIEFYADKYNAVYEIREIVSKRAVDHVIDYTKTHEIDHLIIGETKSAVVSLVLQISPVQYLLKHLPNVLLTIVPYNLAVDKEYFDYGRGEKVFVIKVGDHYEIDRSVEEEVGAFKGIFYKDNTTDFDTGIIYIFVDNSLKQMQVTNGKLDNF